MDRKQDEASAAVQGEIQSLRMRLQELEVRNVRTFKNNIEMDSMLSLISLYDESIK